MLGRDRAHLDLVLVDLGYISFEFPDVDFEVALPLEKPDQPFLGYPRHLFVSLGCELAKIFPSE